VKKIIDNEFATLIVYPGKKIVHHKYKKFIFGEAFQEVMTQGADVFIKYKCTKWLSDDRDNAAMRQEDITWSQTFWEKRIRETGWKYWALIMPKKTVGQIAMKEIIDRNKELGVIVEIFTNPTQAMEWLEKQE
jgi:hypothetical protein